MKKLVFGLLMLVGMLVLAQGVLPRAGQQHTYDGTKFAKQTKGVIEVRDLPGMICDGSADASSVLNALTFTQDSISNRTVSFKSCNHVRLDQQWLIKYQHAPTIDLSETQLLGCNGAAGPMILIQRSIGWTVTASTRGSAIIYTNGGSWCGGARSNFTGGIGTDNDFHTYPGGYTNTAGTLTNIAINGVGTKAGFKGFSTTGAENQENFTIANNIVNCNASQGSVGIYMPSTFAQNAHITHNSVVGCMWGIWWQAPDMFVEYNNLTANGDWDIFTPTTTYGGSSSGAGLFCIGLSNVIRGNVLAEGSGAFLWGRYDSGGGSCGALMEGNSIRPDWVNVGCNGTGCGLHGGHHVPVGQRAVESSGPLVLVGNVGDNRTSRGVLNTVPLIGDGRYPGGVNSQAQYTDLGNTWAQPAAVFDAVLPSRGSRHFAMDFNDQDWTTYDEIARSAWGGSGSHSTPGKIFRTGNPAVGTFTDFSLYAQDDLHSPAVNGTSLNIDVARNDSGTPAGFTVYPSFYGGVSTTAAIAAAAPYVSAQGGGSGSTWGYKVRLISGAGTGYTTAETTVSNASTLDSSHWSRVAAYKYPGYVAYQLWLTTNPGDGRGTGKIAEFRVANASLNCVQDNVQGCDTGQQRYYMTDKGQAIITAGAPPATNADGRVTAVGGVQPANTGGLLTWFQVARHASLDLASVANAACSSETSETVTGAALGDSCSVAAATALEAGAFFRCAVTAANTVKWAFCNLSGSAIDRTSDTYTIRVIR